MLSAECAIQLIIAKPVCHFGLKNHSFSADWADQAQNRVGQDAPAAPMDADWTLKHPAYRAPHRPASTRAEVSGNPA